MFVVVDGPLRRHLVAAVEGYQAALRRNGIAPLPDLRELVNALRVSECQSGSRITDSGVPEDAETMQQTLALSYRDSADRLGVSESTVKRLVKSGDLPVVNIAGVRRIRADDLYTFLESLATTNGNGRGAA